MGNYGGALLHAEQVGVTFRKWFSPPKQALHAVSVAVHSGEVVALLGPNGAGKSTLMRAACGLIIPQQGEITVLGEEPGAVPAVRRQIGAVFESERWMIWQLTGRENLDYFAALRGLTHRRARLQRVDACLAEVGLTAAARRPVGEYSRGMKQRLAIAGALLTEPRLLLLDEPTLGLDLEGQSLIRTIVARLCAAGCGILLATHQLELAARLAHRIAFLREGRLIIDRPVSALLEQFPPAGFAITVQGQMSWVQAEYLKAAGCRLGEPEGDRHPIHCPPAVAVNPYPLLNWLGAQRLTLLHAGQQPPDLDQVYARLLWRDADCSGAALPPLSSDAAG